MTHNQVFRTVLGATLVLAGFGCGGDDGSDDSNVPGNPNAGAGSLTGGAMAAGTGGTAGPGVTTTGGTGTAGTGIASGGMGGVAPGGMGGATAGTGATTSCTITPSLTMSPVISTVATVEFTTDLANMESARIEYGRDQTYGMSAPVDLAEPGYKTVLLGMKPSSQYHYRVVVAGGGQTCMGGDNTLQTGPPPNQPNLFDIDTETPQPAKVNPGFTITGFFMQGPAAIIDSDGDYVWWYDAGDVGRARMSYDGKYMWIRNTNVMGGSSLIQRVSMDGTEVMEYGTSSAYGDGHHDFTVLPDESLLLIAHTQTCDKIIEVSADGTARDVLDVATAHGGFSCHANSIHYLAEDNTFTFSDLNQNCYVKATREGEVAWILGGSTSTFSSGSGVEWNREHGHHVLGPNRMLMFENGNIGASSSVYELELDPAAGTAERVWQYSAPGLSTVVMGDVQRLDNGNTMVAYTTAGTIHEVDADSNLVQSFVFGLGGAVAYIQHRNSLYGPPPR